MLKERGRGLKEEEIRGQIRKKQQLKTVGLSTKEEEEHK